MTPTPSPIRLNSHRPHQSALDESQSRNKGSKRIEQQLHALNVMVWKKSKHKNSDSQGSIKLNSVLEEPRLRGCLKHKDSSRQGSSQGSHRLQGGDSVSRDQSTKSAASRSVGSRSGESRGSGSSSAQFRVCSEQKSSTSSGSCASSERGSRKSDHGPSSRNSDRSSPSVISHLDVDINKHVRFNAILIRDYERVVGDNPSCTSGPPIG